MAIPNVKRFRAFCPTCNDNFTLMAVLPKDASVDQYLADAVARHDHKAFQESKVAALQDPRRPAEAEESEVGAGATPRCRLRPYNLACKVRKARKPSCATSVSGSLLSFWRYGMLSWSPLRASTPARPIFSSLVPVSSGP